MVGKGLKIVKVVGFLFPLLALVGVGSAWATIALTTTEDALVNTLNDLKKEVSDLKISSTEEKTTPTTPVVEEEKEVINFEADSAMDFDVPIMVLNRSGEVIDNTFNTVVAAPTDTEKTNFLSIWEHKREFKPTSGDDGDTFKGYYLDDATKKSETIRFMGIDTPEVPGRFTSPTQWGETWGKRASWFAKRNLFNPNITNRKIYLVDTLDTTFGRIVASVWYADTDERGVQKVYSYAHSIVHAGLAIPARPNGSADIDHTKLDEYEQDGDKVDDNQNPVAINLGTGAFESYFDTSIAKTFVNAAVQGNGFWTTSRKEDVAGTKIGEDSGGEDILSKKNRREDSGENYETIQSWFDIYDNDFDFLDSNLAAIPETMDSNDKLKTMASFIINYLYAGVNWWYSNNLAAASRATNYCTLDTITKTTLPTGETGSVCPVAFTTA